MDINDIADRIVTLADRFGLPTDDRCDLSLVPSAIACAVAAEGWGLPTSYATALRALEICPPSMTGFERGIAFGLALALSSELVEGQAPVTSVPPVRRGKPDLRIVR